ncbi:hypothetical protein [Candidatus Hepatobacter penaei]|uniref:hypothetical protein n=1 Tax=Candidatus Hepatobacter penaei TaxID=1274402 RepID=UPI0004F26D44|nr:hypothetical protein [Candidatus Hepatobacter penaei]TGW14917.1 hypothetical protein EIL50_03205 [bacterium NHP-B]
MFRLNKFIACLLVWGSFWGPCLAVGGERTVSLSSGYFINAPLVWSNSNMAFSHFFQEINMAHGALLDTLSDTWMMERNPLLLTLGDLPLNFWISLTELVSYHEYGRYSRLRAFGYDVDFEIGVNEGRKICHNPFSFTGNLFLNPFRMGRAFPKERLWHPEGTHDLENPEEDEAFMVAVSGLNNIMRFAGDLGDGVYAGRAHSSEFIPYLMGKLGGLFYPQKLMSGLYHTDHMPISTSTRHKASLMSFLLSASTYSYILSFTHGDLPIEQHVTPLEFYGIRAPDLEVYFLTQGTSYRIKSGYRASHSLSFPVSVEFVPSGHKGCELTFGVHKHFETLADLGVGVNVMVGRGLDWDLHVHMPLGDLMFVEGSVEKMGLKSYYGQRNIPTLKHSHHSYAFLLRAGFRY